MPIRVAFLQSNSKEERMKAILVDPGTQTFTEVEHTGDYKNIYTLIEADPFDIVRLSEANSMYVDDEGLLREPPPEWFMIVNNQPLAGKGLILGNNAQGESISTTLTIDEAKALIGFERLSFDGFEQYPEGTRVDHPILGNVPLIGSRPLFSKPKG
jgi:hypothetical protein